MSIWAYKQVRISFDDLYFDSDLVVWHKSEIGVILGMDWLFAFRVQIYCFTKMTAFQYPELRSVTISTSLGNAFVDTFLAHIGSEE